MRLPLPAALTTTALLCALLGTFCTSGSRIAKADEATRQRLMGQAVRLLKQAEQHSQAGREPRALESAKRALALVAQADRQKPGAVDTAFLGVQAAVFAKDRAAARLWAARYAQRSPYGDADPDLHYAHALIWLLLEDRPADAVRSLDRMAKVSRGGLGRAASVLFYDALSANGARLLRLARVSDAVAQFKRASEVAVRLGDSRKEKTARANGAIALLEFGHVKDAEKLLVALRAGDTKNPLWAWYLGRCLTLQRRFDEAGPLYQEVCEAVERGALPERHLPMLRRAFLELGRVRRENAKRAPEQAARKAALEGARAAFERFTHLSPKVAEGWYRLGRLLYTEFDEPYEAIPKLEKAYELDPVCEQALQLLILITTRHGPPAESAEVTSGEAARAWDERTRGWQRALETRAAEWAAERARRSEASPRGWDGCPR